MKYTTALTFSFIVLATVGYAQPTNTGKYLAGFISIHLTDSSRIYKKNSDAKELLHFRPVDLDVWYPAKPPGKVNRLLFADLLSLLEKRANYYSGTDAGIGFAGQVAKMFCQGFKCSDSVHLLHYRTSTWKAAKAAKGNWPLIIYCASYGSTSYENFKLMESLAADGYIAVCISSIGRFPGDMTTSKEDLFEQVEDARFAVTKLKNFPYADLKTIAVIGYSWGGLAGILLPEYLPDIKCVISYEGSEFHHYGQKEPDGQKEDSNFNDLIQSREFRNRSNATPYLRLECASSTKPESFDSVYHFADTQKNKRIFQITRAQHEDFCSIGPVVRLSGNCKVDFKYRLILELTIGYLDQQLNNRESFQMLLKKFTQQEVTEVK